AGRRVATRGCTRRAAYPDLGVTSRVLPALALAASSAACGSGAGAGAPPPDARRPAPAAATVPAPRAPPLVDVVGPALAAADPGARDLAITAIARLAVRGALAADDGVAILRATPTIPPPPPGAPDAQATAIDAVLLRPAPAYVAAIDGVADTLR